jgi:hypothetical protein
MNYEYLNPGIDESNAMRFPSATLSLRPLRKKLCALRVKIFGISIPQSRKAAKLLSQISADFADTKSLPCNV